MQLQRRNLLHRSLTTQNDIPRYIAIFRDTASSPRERRSFDHAKHMSVVLTSVHSMTTLPTAAWFNTVVGVVASYADSYSCMCVDAAENWNWQLKSWTGTRARAQCPSSTYLNRGRSATTSTTFRVYVTCTGAT